METKHTPGPWNIHFNDTGHATSIMADHKICVMQTNNLDECNANAKLIAAAPELLEALIIAIDALDPEKEHLDYDDGAFLEIKKAIKKATE